MEISSEQLTFLLDDAIDAAKAASEVIMKFRHDTVEVRRKSGSSLATTVVTDVDGWAQDVILEKLKPAMERFDIALLSEEQPDDHARFEKAYFWCVDPLDGTLPFIEKTAGYSVSISLISNEGIPYIGVILDPENNVLYHGVRGKGAFRNHIPWFPCTGEGFCGRPLTALFDRSTMAASNYGDICKVLEEVASSFSCVGVKTLSYGGAAMNACYVLEHAPACYVKLPRTVNSGGSLWDYGASACIFSECHAVATDIFGNNLDLNRNDSTYMNHRGFIYATHTELGQRLKKNLLSLNYPSGT